MHNQLQRSEDEDEVTKKTKTKCKLSLGQSATPVSYFNFICGALAWRADADQYLALC